MPTTSFFKTHLPLSRTCRSGNTAAIQGVSNNLITWRLPSLVTQTGEIKNQSNNPGHLSLRSRSRASRRAGREPIPGPFL